MERSPRVDPAVPRREEAKEKARDAPRRGAQKIGRPREAEKVFQRVDVVRHRQHCRWARLDELSDH